MTEIEFLRLGKPFKFVKQAAVRMYANGGWVSSKVNVYLDPRGGASFAVPVPRKVADATKGKYQFTDESGQFIVREMSVDEVVDTVSRAWRDFADIEGESAKREVILVYFDGVAPRVLESGSPIEQEWVYKDPRQSFGGSAGQRHFMTFSCERGFDINGVFCVRNGEGNMERRYSHRGRIIPFSEEVWASLVAARDCVEKMVIDLAHATSSQDPEDIPGRLANLGCASPATRPSNPLLKSVLRRQRQSKLHSNSK